MVQEPALVNFLHAYPHPAWILGDSCIALALLSPQQIVANSACRKHKLDLLFTASAAHNKLESTRRNCLTHGSTTCTHQDWLLTWTLLSEQDAIIITCSPTNEHFGSPISPDFVENQTFIDQLQLTEMGRRVIDFDWSTTTLGAINSWSDALRAAILYVLRSPERMAIFLNDDLFAIYNEQYKQVLGEKDAYALGMGYPKIHAEIWNMVEPLAAQTMAGDTVSYKDSLLLMSRSSQDDMNVEETYHDWSFVPFRLHGKVCGFLNFSTETTYRVVYQRRMDTMRTLVDSMFSTRTQQEFRRAIIGALSTNPQDIPFLMLYSCHSPRFKSRRDHRTLKLEGALGVPEGHPAFEEIFDICLHSDDSITSKAQTISSTSSTSMMCESSNPFWPLQSVLLSGKSEYIQPTADKPFVGFEQRGWDEASRYAMAIPITGGSDQVELLLVIGLNPRRPRDTAYLDFINLMSKHISTAHSAVENYELEKKKADELASLDRAKTAFFGNCSHELRSPLQLILGPLEDVMGQKHALPKEVTHSLALVQRHSRRLHTLVNSLLDFAKMEAGRAAFCSAPVKISKLTADLASLFRSAIERSGVVYNVDCETDTCFVMTDESAWEKIVCNLISNAFKYCLSGTITVAVRFHKHKVIFTCSDTGIGIAADEIKNIFTRFHRVTTAGRSVEGTGIGLALTAETVQILGGKITVESELGQGSTFTVTLPCGTVQASTEQPSSQKPVKSAMPGPRYGLALAEQAISWLSDSSGRTSTTADGKSTAATSEHAQINDERWMGSLSNSIVVVVDDNRDLNHYCSGLLGEYYHTKSFYDGASAWEYILHNPVDLVVSDVTMPHKDGFELLNDVRLHPQTCLIPFILLSAKAGSNHTVEGLNSGADDYIPKPFTRNELLTRAKTQLENGRIRRELERRVSERTNLLVESESRLQSRIEESEHLRKQQNIVVDISNHEMRNPLNALHQTSRALEEDLDKIRLLLQSQRVAGKDRQAPWLDESEQLLELGRDHVESIMLSTSHMTRIADDILNFSKIQMSLLTIHRIPFDLHDAIHSVIRMWESEAKDKSINLTLEMSTETEQIQWIFSDPHRTSQILINFLVNAIRYTSDSSTRKVTVAVDVLHPPLAPPGEGCYRIGTDTTVLPENGFWLKISVKDSGRGLTDADLEKLFERFSQADSSKDQFSGGHGLGLFVTRHLVGLLDGYIEVRRAANEAGCTFAFSLPVEAADAQPDNDELKSWRARMQARQFKSSGTSRPPLSTKSSEDVYIKRVLIAEDNIINQKVLVRQMQSQGFSVNVANNGQEAVDYLLDCDASRFPHVILMDVEMPIKDGKEACGEIRAYQKSGRLAPVGIIAVTGNARQEQVDECLQVGFDRVAIKPYKLDELVKMMEQVYVD